MARFGRIFTLLLIGLVMLASSVGGARAEKRVAFVIGNSSYTHLPALANPVNDAENLREALISIGFDVVFAKDVTRSDFDKIYATFNEKMQSADVALVYYAGHGIQQKGVNYLIPVDAEISGSSRRPPCQQTCRRNHRRFG